MSSGRPPFFERLDALIEELTSVSRDARAIHSPPPGILPGPDRGNIADSIHSLLSLRTSRLRQFGSIVDDESTWEMILHIVKADAEGTRLSISGLTAVTGTAATSTIRKLEDLERAALATRRPDPRDGRRTLVEPTVRSRELVVRFFKEAAGEEYQRPDPANSA